MEKDIDIRSTVFSTTLQKVLDFMLQHPDLELNDTEISGRISGARKSAVNMALRRLAELGLIERTPRGRMNFSRLIENTLTTELKVLSNMLAISEFTEDIKPFSSKVVLFGSRADGTHTSESDFDMLIVTSVEDRVLKAIKKCPIGEMIQPLIKRPEQMLTFDKDEPALSKEIKKGKVLWERS